MKKIITTLAFLSAIANIQAKCLETFPVSLCNAQVVTTYTNNLNPKQFAASICVTKDKCGNKMATISLTPTSCATQVVSCGTPVVSYTAPVVSCGTPVVSYTAPVVSSETCGETMCNPCAM